MSVQTIIIAISLFVINAVLAASEICRRRDFKRRLKELRQSKIYEDEEEDLKDEIEPSQANIWIEVIAICLDIWIVGALLTHLWAGAYFTDVAENDSRKALFGDSFGGVNALVSALAFAGMIVALVLQRYELRLQRKELRDNRAEMSRQTSQFQAENTNLETQRFENLFYNMLNLQQEIGKRSLLRLAL